MELVVLEAIMDRVGHDLPIQELFDVTMGTSTGASKRGLRYTQLTNSRWYYRSRFIQEEMDCRTSNEELRGTGKVCVLDARVTASLDRASRIASLRPALLQFSLQKRRYRTCSVYRVR